MASKLPYVPSYGVITKTLEKIKTAATPPRFTQDFLATKLNLKGGSPKPVIPFLKRIGFLGSDGVPTDVYRRFRNPSEAGHAAAQALRVGYSPMFEVNEYAHDLNDKDLKGLIVQVTGLEPDSGTTKAILGSFKALRDFAGELEESEGSEEQPDEIESTPGAAPPLSVASGQARLGLSYTINLNLPATSDVAVFNAIFSSLKQHLLR